MMNRKYNVGIFLFNEVEVLDFAGPFEVFSIAEYQDSKEKIFKVSTIAQTKNLIKARNGLKILPDYDFTDVPKLDILIIPGGYGAEEIEIHNKEVINWIVKYSEKVEILASVCTGAFLLAKGKLLDGKKATTHWMDIDRLEKEFEKITVERNAKYIDEGSIITSAGISAGINMAFYIISKLTNKEIARNTAKRMEYDISI